MKTKKNLFRPISATAFAVVTFASFASQSAQAATGSWTAAVDGNWGVDANWTGATFPNGEGQAANFSVNTPDLLITTTLDGDYTVATSAINSGQSADWLVTSPTNTLTFQVSSGNASIANNFNGSSLYTLDTNILLNSNLVLSGNGNSNAKVTLGAVVGGRAITGIGDITISNTSTFGAGVMTINSNINTSGGIFNNSSQGQNHVIAGAIGSTVTGVTQSSARNLTLSGNNTYTTATTVSQGNLIAGVATVPNVSGAFGINSAVTTSNVASTSLNLNSFNTQIGSLAGGGTTGGAVALGSATLTTGGLNTDSAFAGIISGTGGLTKIGTGAQTLSAANTFTGAININAGTLQSTTNANNINTALAINLGGGRLQLTSNGGARTYTTLPLNVTAASSLDWNNTSATSAILTIDGTVAFSLGDKLTIRNTSTTIANINQINLNRPMTGAGNLEVETYNNIATSADGFGPGRVQLAASSPSWTGNLVITRGTVSLSGSTASTTGDGSGDIVIGAVGNALGAGLTFNTSTNLTYLNDIIVNTGGFRAIRGNGFSNVRVTFSGAVALNGDLTLDHSWGTSDNRITLDGVVSGNGGLTITRAGGGNVETTAVMTKANTYTGPTVVKSTASLSVTSTSSLASNITVESTGRIGGGGGTSGSLTLASGANFFFFYSPTYVPFDVGGTVTVDPTFGIANLRGGSRGEVVPWSTVPNGSYTLIAKPGLTFDASTITNFGFANRVNGLGSLADKSAYFENGASGLQLVVTTAAVDPYTTWSGGAAFNVDTNNDGVSNGLAFLLGAANVDANANGLLPAPTQNGGALTLTFSMLNAAARGTASLQVQHSSDLGISDAWSTLVTVPNADGTDSGIVFTVAPGVSPLNNVTATIPASGNAAGGKLFGRVKSNP